MFPRQYDFAWQSREVRLSLGFPPAALPAFIGTIRPSDCLCAFCLPSLVVQHTAKFTPPSAEHTGSPQLMQCLCVTWLTLDPGTPRLSLAFSTISRVAFRPIHSVGTPIQYFGAELPSDPITSLSTLGPQHYCCVPKTRYRWLVRPYRAGFPPAIHCTLLLGARTVPCVHNKNLDGILACVVE